MIYDNRIGKAIDATRAKLEELNAVARDELDAAMAVDFEEHFAYQELQARSHLEGTLTTDEATIVYVALGEVGSPSNGGWASGTDLATKVVVTRLMAELLQKRLAATVTAEARAAR